MLKKLKLSKENQELFTATSVIAGTCIGAGFLGIPYVAAQSGFLVVLAYLVIFSGLILLINLYLGEIVLRTRKKYQITGYAEKYLGKRGKTIMLFATKFTIYSAIVAYTIGVGQSISLLLFGDIKYYLAIGLLFGGFMAFLIKGGIKSLKKFEKTGVVAALILLFAISILFANRVDFNNLNQFNLDNVLLPFGVVLFSMMSLFSIPQTKMVLGKNKKLIKKAIIFGTFTPAIFYLIFTFVVVGFMGIETPEIATFALGNVFILMGIIAMFTSYLSLGNALQQDYIFDFGYSKKKAWLRATIIPIFIFLLTQLFGDFFSFIRVISLAGVISGGVIAILILVIKKRSESLGDDTPEFTVPINGWVILGLALIFVTGIFLELSNFY